MITHLTPLLLGATLLLSCTVPPEPASSTPDSPPAVRTEETLNEPLPETVRDRIKADLASQLDIPAEQLVISQYSRETFSDGCLGLGGPAESCLAALTEGWQVEVINPQTGQRYLYRSDLTGDQIRRSEAEQSLPESVRDRIFATAERDGLNPSRRLEIIAAEPQIWGGCYGLATATEMCTEVAISGWRAVLSDGEQYWIYHTDSRGETVRLNATASGGTAVPMFIPRGYPQDLGDETSVQSIIRHDSGIREVVMLEADGRLFQIRSREGEVLDRTITTVGQSRTEVMWQRLEQSNFAHVDGIRYQPKDTDAPLVELMTRRGVVEYAAGSLDSLPPDLQTVIQQWKALQ
ncbi:hypothetical protein IQ254_02885 [Nodosilinea sp. LEGE 07088]|uniref:hypothetical protein n=1 Tax=Nodosilinea sp. LEGE 07088 TaxID=2777968 RepID=UPI001882F392|nr:hypothetical protein [Nodosilinea sp. LEGE 07088]MBE9136155.1 hypothetical protein [Nodosilinea sp. LEGE 07088]